MKYIVNTSPHTSDASSPYQFHLRTLPRKKTHPRQREKPPTYKLSTRQTSISKTNPSDKLSYSSVLTNPCSNAKIFAQSGRARAFNDRGHRCLSTLHLTAALSTKKTTTDGLKEKKKTTKGHCLSSCLICTCVRRSG